VISDKPGLNLNKKQRAVLLVALILVVLAGLEGKVLPNSFVVLFVTVGTILLLSDRKRS
jgi:hypothetical protein